MLLNMDRSQIITPIVTGGLALIGYFLYKKYTRRQNLFKKFKYTKPEHWNPNKESITVCSWNTLHRFYRGPAFDNLEKEFQEFAFRGKKIRKMLGDFKADILCLQEAHLRTIEEDYVTHLKTLGFDVLIPKLKKSDEKHAHTKPTIFYKNEKFKLLWSKYGSRAMMAQLEHLATGKTFFIVNVHCNANRWSDNKSKYEDELGRFYQINAWMKKIANVAKSKKLEIEDVRLLVLGDFNAQNHELSHQFLKTGKIPKSFRGMEEMVSKHRSATQEFLGLSDVYGLLEEFRPKTLHRGRSGTLVDFIYQKGFVVQSIRNPLTENYLDEQIPNQEIPSDHFPLVAEMNLN